MTKVPAAEEEINLLSSAISSMVAAAEVNLHLATLPSAGPGVRLMLLQSAEVVYEGALDLIECLMASAGRRPDSGDNGTPARPDAPSHAGQGGAQDAARQRRWQERLDTCTGIHRSICDSLFRIQALIVGEGRWHRAAAEVDRVIDVARRRALDERGSGGGNDRRSRP